MLFYYSEAVSSPLAGEPIFGEQFIDLLWSLV
jgi:hypothetical protein